MRFRDLLTAERSEFAEGNAADTERAKVNAAEIERSRRDALAREAAGYQAAIGVADVNLSVLTDRVDAERDPVRKATLQVEVDTLVLRRKMLEARIVAVKAAR